MIDVNLYAGEYPFRRLPDTRGEGLLRLMDEMGCARGIATSFASVFYKDNLDGLKKALEETAGVGERVFFYAVINPAFPGWEQDFDEAVDLPGVVGVRLFPRYHHYQMLAEPVRRLMEKAAARSVPVNVAMRLVDDRLHHWLLHVPSLDPDQLGGLLKQHPATTVILSQFYASEIAALAAPLRAHPAAYVDLGNTKPNNFWFDQVVNQFDPGRLLLGTGAPLYYHGGTLLSFQEARLDPEVKQRIAHDNAAELFKLGG